MSAKNIKIHWVHLDQYGSVTSCYRGNDGKLYRPVHVGVIWADRTEADKCNSPGMVFDVTACGAVYRIQGAFYVVESCCSKIYKPLNAALKQLASRNPVVALPHQGACLACRADLQSVVL